MKRDVDSTFRPSLPLPLLEQVRGATELIKEEEDEERKMSKQLTREGTKSIGKEAEEKERVDEEDEIEDHHSECFDKEDEKTKGTSSEEKRAEDRAAKQ